MIRKMNEALIKQINLAKVKNHSIIEKATGIDKSTISLHLNSRRPISIEQARAYAKFLDVPLIKVIDDTVVKYRVVKYSDDLGEVSDPTEEDFDVILAPNEIESTHQYCIFDKNRNTVYWYDPKQSCENVNTINEYCYIKTDKIDYLGSVINHNETHIEFINIHTTKKIKMKFHKCYPLTGITFCKFATVTKIHNSL